MDHELVLELAGVSRQFGAVRALRNVSFDCRAGEVHALVGENGSGKSTLLGIASGSSIRIAALSGSAARPCRRDSPALSRKLGLAMAYQDGSSVLAEPVKNNLYYAAPPTSRPPYWRRKKWARQVLADFDLDLELFPDAPVGTLTMAERQLFEVAKALVSEPKVLLLDEPTTALGPDEVEALHRTVAGLQAARHRCRLRQPPAARSARDRRPDHRAPRRRSTREPSTPRSTTRGRARGAASSAARSRRRSRPAAAVGRGRAKCWWSTACRVRRSVR